MKLMFFKVNGILFVGMHESPVFDETTFCMPFSKLSNPRIVSMTRNEEGTGTLTLTVLPGDPGEVTLNGQIDFNYENTDKEFEAFYNSEIAATTGV